MKSKLINPIFIVILFIVGLGQAASKTMLPEKKFVLEDVEIIDEFYNFYKSGNYYFGGQPTLEALRWLKSEGVTLVVNLRSESENENFAEDAFDEKNMVKEMGMVYKSIPVSYPDSYTPETLDEFIEALYAHQGKIFIHCAGAGRVRLFFMAYLVKAKNYSLDEAFSFGKQLEYNFLLEDLLGKEIKMSF